MLNKHICRKSNIRYIVCIVFNWVQVKLISKRSHSGLFTMYTVLRFLRIRVVSCHTSIALFVDKYVQILFNRIYFRLYRKWYKKKEVQRFSQSLTAWGELQKTASFLTFLGFIQVVKEVQTKRRTRRSLLFLAHSCRSLMFWCVLLVSCSQREADSRPGQWNSHDQPSRVASLPGKHPPCSSWIQRSV